MGAAEKTTVIDFLYRDFSRIDSLFAQLFQGNLKEIAATSACANKQANVIEGSIPGIVKGGYNGEETITDTISKKIDPHDQKILELLNILNISDKEELISNDNKNGCVMLLKGQFKFRDYKSLKEAMPIVSEVAPLFGFFGQNKKEFDKLSKLITGMINIIPLGLELEFTTTQDEILIGNLKNECFAESPNDLLRIYGNNLPGQWQVLGIVDILKSSDSSNKGDSVRASLDGFAEMIKGLYTSTNIKYSIIPIVVFRELNAG